MKNITTSTNKNCCCYCCYVASVVSDSSGPHRWQPTRLHHPWDSPGKNTGVGCHFLLQCMKVKSEREVAQSCLTLSDPMDCGPPGSSVHGIFQASVLKWGATAFSALPSSVFISNGTTQSLYEMSWNQLEHPWVMRESFRQWVNFYVYGHTRYL